MTPDLGQRLANALDEMQSLGARDVERYLRRLRASDPEVAARLDALLNPTQPGTDEGSELDVARILLHPSTPVGAPPTDANRREPSTTGEPTASIDARATLSFPLPGSASARDDTRDPPTVGRSLGRYELVRRVGRGAFGDVWKAFDPVLQKHVAVKVARADRADPLPATTFLDEARKVASLRHHAIVHVYDAGASAGGWYIVSDFIDGYSLRSRMAAGRLPLDRAVRITATIAGALHAAHLTGLVHRDVKPGNVMLDRAGNAYLTDFGLAVREEEQFAERSKVAGTLAYMAPEQIAGDTHLLDGRADIYALGAVLYELLTDRPLFRASDVEDYRELILRREPRPPRAIDSAVPEELERICLKCLAKEVKDRYLTAQDLAIELDAWLAGTTRSDHVAPARASPAPDRPKRVVIGAAVALVLLAGVVGVVLYGGAKTRSTAPTPPDEPTADRAVPLVKPLLWSNRNPFNEWRVLPNNDQLKVSTASPALLEVGAAHDPDWTFSATFQQLQDVGGIGLFFGHRREDKFAKFELVCLVWFKDRADPKDQFRLQRSLEWYPPDVPSADPEGAVLASFSPDKRLHENTIRLTVRKDGLSEVYFNGDPVWKVPPGTGRSTLGPFGVYNMRSESLVSNLRLNDQPIRLVGPVPQAPERP